MSSFITLRFAIDTNDGEDIERSIELKQNRNKQYAITND